MGLPFSGVPMGLAKCVLLGVITAVFSLSLSAQVDRTSKVLSDHTAIYSQASTKSRVVGQFQRGQEVLVDFMITNADGSWCQVREPEQNGRVGYVLCQQLTNEALPKSSSVHPLTEMVETPASAGPANPPSAESANVLGRWATELGLSEEQNKAIATLLVTSGLIASRDDLAAAFRSYGVTGPESLLHRSARWAQRPYGDSFAATVEPKVRRGGASYKTFWHGVWNVMTHDQRENASNTRFLLFYLGSQSDPETAFQGYVLQYMRSTNGHTR